MRIRHTCTIVGFALLLSACQFKTASTSWVAVKSAEGGFTINFPEQPRETQKNVALGSDTITIHDYALVRNDGYEYSIQWNDYPLAALGGRSPDRVFDNIRNGYTRDGKKLLSEKTITISGKPGRELEAEINAGTFHRIRLLMVGNRLYQLMIYAPIAKRDDPDLAKFLDSFSL